MSESELDEYHKNRLREEGLLAFAHFVGAFKRVYSTIPAEDPDGPYAPGGFDEIDFEDMVTGFYMGMAVAQAPSFLDDMNDREVDGRLWRLVRLTEWWRWDKK